MKHFEEKRKEERQPYSDRIEFIVLYMQAADFKRLNSNGKVINVSLSGMGLVTEFPLEAGHILEWPDKHQKDKLHIALVKWSAKINEGYRAGLMFI